MKLLLKVVEALVALAVLALVVFSIIGLGPQQHRPGLWLKGDPVASPVDWAFTDKYPTIMVETHPWYMIPHAVTIYCITYNGSLYLHSDFAPGLKFPEGKSWTAAIAHNPSIRLKIGNQVFDRKAVAVTDPAESAALYQATHKKYPDDKTPASNVYFFHVLPR